MLKQKKISGITDETEEAETPVSIKQKRKLKQRQETKAAEKET